MGNYWRKRERVVKAGRPPAAFLLQQLRKNPRSAPCTYERSMYALIKKINQLCYISYIIERNFSADSAKLQVVSGEYSKGVCTNTYLPNLVSVTHVSMMHRQQHPIRLSRRERERREREEREREEREERDGERGECKNEQNTPGTKSSVGPYIPPPKTDTFCSRAREQNLLHK